MIGVVIIEWSESGIMIALMRVKLCIKVMPMSIKEEYIEKEFDHGR
jgi:hypothetical protein